MKKHGWTNLKPDCLYLLARCFGCKRGFDGCAVPTLDLRRSADCSPTAHRPIREIAAWSAAVAAHAAGSVDASQVAMLETICDKLDVPRRALYSALHSAASSLAIPASEPVTVSIAGATHVHSIPRPPQQGTHGLDEERLRRIRSETERVSTVLAGIFVEEEAAAPNPPEDTSENDGFAGLDGSHSAFVKKLIEKPSWPRSDFEAVAREVGLMPDGALESINEWAFEQFDEPLLEDGEPLEINVAVLDLMTERRDKV